jgi:hypothetical protein
MAIHVSCACGKSYNVPDEHAGKRLRCKSCGEVLTIGRPAGLDMPEERPPPQPPSPVQAGDKGGDEAPRPADLREAEVLPRPEPLETGEGARAAEPLSFEDFDLEDLPAPSAREGTGGAATPGPPRLGEVSEFGELPAAQPEPVAPGLRFCPQCGARLQSGAALCVRCGLDVRTGEREVQAAAPRPASRPPRAPVVNRRAARAIEIPVGKILVLAVIVAVVGGVWFGIIRPLQGSTKLDEAFRPATEGDPAGALANLEAVKDELPAKQRRRAELLIEQLRLEVQYGFKGGGTENPTLALEAMEEWSKAGDVTKLLFTVTVENNGSSPVRMVNEHFYLRSQLGMAMATTHRTDALHGRTVGPRERVTGIIPFFRLPGENQGPSAVVFSPPELVYNDGRDYIRVPLAWPDEGAEGEEFFE